MPTDGEVDADEALDKVEGDNAAEASGVMDALFSWRYCRRFWISNAEERLAKIMKRGTVLRRNIAETLQVKCERARI